MINYKDIHCFIQQNVETILNNRMQFDIQQYQQSIQNPLNLQQNLSNNYTNNINKRYTNTKELQTFFENNPQNSLIIELFLKRLSDKKNFLIEQWGLFYNEKYLIDAQTQNEEKNLFLKLENLQNSIKNLMQKNSLEKLLNSDIFKEQKYDFNLDYSISYNPNTQKINQQLKEAFSYTFIKDLKFLEVLQGQINNLDFMRSVGGNLNMLNSGKKMIPKLQGKTSSSGIQKKQRYVSEDNIIMPTNTTNDTTFESTKSQHMKKILRDTSSSSIENQNLQNLQSTSLISLYNRKDDITILSYMDDNILKNMDGKDLELQTIVDDHDHDHDHEFCVIDNDLENASKFNKELLQKIEKQLYKNSQKCFFEKQSINQSQEEEKKNDFDHDDHEDWMVLKEKTCENAIRTCQQDYESILNFFDQIQQ